jgi:geranylgeranyl pyrophosphate synthase
MTNDVHEQIGKLEALVSSAHLRIDALERGIKEDLKDLKRDLRDLNAYMHKTQGWTAALVFIAGLFGAGLSKIISLITR